MLYLKMNIKLLLRDYSLRRCIRNEYRKQRIYRVTLLLKEYTFIYLPLIEALKGNKTLNHKYLNL